MKNVHSSLIICFFLLVFTTGLVFAQSDDFVAVITSVNGTVTRNMKGNAKPEEIAILTQIREGDVLNVRTGAQIKLAFYNDNHVETIAGKGTVKISGNKVTAIGDKGTKIKTIAPYKGLNTFSTVKYTSGKFAGVGFKPLIKGEKLLSPKYVISSLSPQFQWESDPDADYYLVILEDMNKKQLFEVTAKETKIDFPTDCPPLIPGMKYIWYVKSVKNDQVFAIDVLSFSIANDDITKKADEIKKEALCEYGKKNGDATPLIGLMTFYVSNGMFEDAATILEMLNVRYPDNPNIKNWKQILNTSAK
jgi:hypothetical protein